MKTIVTFLLLAMCLPHVASSLPVTVATGPFNVSFDINTTKSLIYQPQYSDTRKGSGSETIVFYGLEIRDINTPDDAAKAQISINEYDNPISYSLEYKADQAAKLFQIIDGTVSIDYRTIDNSPGYVVKGVNEAGRIEYSSGYRIGKQVEVTITGALPEISSILDTIHIEKRSEQIVNGTL
ncbi:MAG: hypothetical protein WB392_05265 [Methanotrichaceae archaeon]